jgi:hypothetical protein
MSTNPSPLVQVYAPDGTLGEVPYERMHDSLQAGGKIAVHIKAPDGTEGYVPGDRISEALQAGAARMPLNMDTTGGMGTGFASHYWNVLKQVPMGMVNAVLTGLSPSEQMSSRINTAQQIAQDEAARAVEGRSLGYRIAAPLAQQIVPGLNPRGMEQAANQGDMGGVLGEAIGAGTLAATPLIGEGLNAGLGSDVATRARQAIAEKVAGPIVRQTPTATANNLKFGRNPAEAITREPGLSGLTVDSLHEGVTQRMHELGQVIDSTLDTPENQAKTISIEPIIDRAAKDAKASPIAKLNPGLSDRIDGLVDNMKSQFGSLDKNPLEAAQFKRDIGSATKWTGQAFDNEANQFLVDVYRGVKDEVNKAVPETKGYNERYADLLGAQKALQRRIVFDTNRALSPGRAMLGAGGGALGTFFGGMHGGILGAALGAGVDLLRSTPGRLSIGKILGNAYPELPDVPVGGAPTIPMVPASAVNLPRTTVPEQQAAAAPGALAFSPGEDLGPSLGTQHEITKNGQRVGSITVEPKDNGVLHVHWLGGEFTAADRQPIMDAIKGEYPETRKITYDRRRLAKGANAATTEGREMNVP